MLWPAWSGVGSAVVSHPSHATKRVVKPHTLASSNNCWCVQTRVPTHLLAVMSRATAYRTVCTFTHSVGDPQGAALACEDPPLSVHVPAPALAALSVAAPGWNASLLPYGAVSHVSPGQPALCVVAAAAQQWAGCFCLLGRSNAGLPCALSSCQGTCYEASFALVRFLPLCAATSSFAHCAFALHTYSVCLPLACFAWQSVFLCLLATRSLAQAAAESS